MTISYTSEVPNGSAFGCFWRILIKWRGSVYKLIWRELLVYLFAYYVINFTYRYALDKEQQKLFEKIRYYFGNSSESIPMSFVLGFYVSLVVKRWWEQYKLLPWPDNLALFISAAIPGNDERGRLMRRNIVRYAVLAYVITLQRISLRVKRRFPSLQHIVDVGLMMESEKKIFEMMNKKAAMSKYWMPLVWATNIINRARKEQLITSDHVVQTLLVELSDIRKKLGGLIGYDTVCVPLVYTQVVTLSLYAYFFSALLGRQFISQSEPNAPGKYEDPDMYFPFFTTLQFCFYVGWLKVAEVLINPFGEDDDDIELNWLIDRHIKAGYMIVDEMHEEHPELLKDQYWDEVVPKDLPYTVASEHYRREEPKGSAEHYKVKQSDALYANVFLSSHVQSHGGPPGHGAGHAAGHRGPKGGPLHMQDDVYADYESVDTPLVERRKNWLQRQITRMGSVRSSSTTYSSGGAGFFSRNRHNSVYSSPENGLVGLPNGLPGQQQQQQQQQQLHSGKPSFYDRFRRKSIQSRQARRDSAGTLPKLSSVPVSLKNRPRIPTPDVSKEVPERDQRLALSASNAASIGAAIVGVLPPPPSYQQTTASATSGTGSGGNLVAATELAHPDSPAVLQVVVSGASPGLVLSPIQEKTELQGAAQLAQAVLPQGLKPGAGFAPPTTTTTTLALPVTMSQLSRLLPGITTTAAPLLANGRVQLCVSPGLASHAHPAYQQQQQQQQLATLTELASASSTGSDDEPRELEPRPPATKQAYNGGPSPVLVDPGKLDAMASLPHLDFKQPNYALQAREHRAARSEAAAKGRRSSSLPGPSLVQPQQQQQQQQQPRDDRSMSLPLSLSKAAAGPPLKPRAVSLSGPAPDALLVAPSSSSSSSSPQQQQQPRPRSGSLERAQPPPIRKISSPLLPSASKRGEVYV